MKMLWKIYDVSLIFIIVAVFLCGMVASYSWILALLGLAAVIAFAAAKYQYYKRKKEKLLFQVRTVSEELDFEQGKAFEKLCVACAAVEKNGSIIWLNDSFAQAFGVDEACSEMNIAGLLKKSSIDKLLEGKGYYLRVDNKYFSVYSSPVHLEQEELYLLYFFDETDLRLTEKAYRDSRPSIMLTVVDNANEIYENFKESDCAAIFSRTEQMIEEWVSSYGGLCRKYSNVRMLIFIEEKGLQAMIHDKFSILDKIREQTFEGKNTDLTLSVGVGNEQNIIESNSSARQALDMAQSRGGDQVAVKMGTQYQFYGGVSEGHEKKNKVRTRLIAKTMSEIISDSDNVLIMGHRFSDFDSFGSAVGMYKIVSHFGKRAQIVVNAKSSLASPLLERFCELAGHDAVLSPEKAHDRAGENTLLIVVDTHKKDFTECPELIDQAGKLMVIDHHRKSVDFIENTVMFYHMPNSSSTSEMVTEIAQYVDTKPVLDQFAALALFSGIMLDTRNFIIRAGVRTFEAAAYLRSRGANTVECKKLFSNDMEVFRNRNTIIDSAEEYRGCALSAAQGDMENIRLVTSQAADEMLNIEGVKASFVLYRSGTTANISARSYGEINVQLIMESMGGGGHQTMSACQLENTDLDSARATLKKAIDDYFSNL